MRKICHSVCADLQDLLNEYATLAHQFRNRALQFNVDAEVWILKAEEVFNKHKLLEKSKLAHIAGSIAAVRRGHLNTEKSKSLRTEKNFQCWQLLNEGQDLVFRSLAAENEKIEKSENLLTQLIIIGMQKKLFDFDFLNVVDLNRTEQIRQVLFTEPDFSSGILQLKSLISQVDIIILLDKILDNLSE